MNAWIERQKEPDLSRPEAVRRLVELGIKGEEVMLRQIHRFASFVLVSTFAVTFGSKANDKLPHLRKRYEDCVYRSVHLQGMGGTWEAFELAFLAYQRKERAITEHLGALGMTPATIDKALQAFKLRLRKTVR